VRGCLTEITRSRRDGTAIDVSMSTAPVLDDAGRLVGIIGIAVDITERKRAELELEERRRDDRHLASIVSSSGDAMMSASLDGTVTSWNAGAERMFGYLADEVIGQPLTMLQRPEELAAVREFIGQVFAGHAVIGAEGVGLRKDGTEFPIAFSVSPLLQADDTVIGLSSVARDITAQKALEAALERRALHDELTGLPNRVLFVDRLALALARLPRHEGLIAVLFVDVDQFKVINDSLGHDQGDRLLGMIAERLTQDPLAAPEAVHLGGVEQRHAKVDRAADDIAGLLPGVILPVAPFPRPELPRAQANLGDPRSRADVQIPHATTPSLLF